MQYVEEIKNLRSLILNDLSSANANAGQSLTDATNQKKDDSTNKAAGQTGAQTGHQGGNQQTPQVTGG